jgi:RNA polymerase sigma factor (TIGR02999 family)
LPEDITLLLNSTRAGDKDAESRLISLVYAELRHIAARQLHRERPGHTLQTTALVNEAYVKMFTSSQTTWKDRAHFFGFAAQVMRHILIDHARTHLARKRGGGTRLLPLDEAIVVSPDRLEELLVLEDALLNLEQHDPRVGRVVVMRFYGGLDVDEIAYVLQISTRTVKRDWNYGRAWLKAELTSKAGNELQGPRSN